jgi:hypothetical protein
MQIPSGSNWDGLTSVVFIGGLSLVFLILSLDILGGVRSLFRDLEECDISSIEVINRDKPFNLWVIHQQFCFHLMIFENQQFLA